MEFYKINSIPALLKVLGLSIYLRLLSFMSNSRLKSIDEVEEFLMKFRDNLRLNELTNNFSLLISPTRDKLILYDHHNYYRKVGWDKSFEKVKNEIDFYSNISNRDISFKTARVLEKNVDSIHRVSSLMMSREYVQGVKVFGKERHLLIALSVFFKSSSNKNISISVLLGNFLLKLNEHSIEISEEEDLAIKNILQLSGNELIELGYVHGDFKPRNVVLGKSILLYDFEESSTEGLPLEDYFNYIISPLIYSKDCISISAQIHSKKRIRLYRIYLDRVGAKLGYENFLLLYLLKYMLLMHKEGYSEAFLVYRNLLNNFLQKPY